MRNGASDMRRHALEDLCSVLNLPTEAKYDGTIERVARAVCSLSTCPDEDVQLVLRRALFAWLIADGDLHFKKMARLKSAEPGGAYAFGGGKSLTCRLAPVSGAPRPVPADPAWVERVS
jgi:serine/threonine-protein kinase HipA